MSNEKLSFGKCIPASDLTPSQIAALPFVPGNITSFDEQNPLPPSGRGHWSFIKENPGDFIEKFSLELGFLGVRIGVFFLVNEKFESPDKQSTSDITVNLITQPETFSEIEGHLKANKLAYKVLDTGSGFALPYLGSIQKVLDSLKLESVINYLFIKNLISRENYFCWLSVPEALLKNTRPNILEKLKQSDAAGKKTPPPFEPSLRKSYGQKQGSSPIPFPAETKPTNPVEPKKKEPVATRDALDLPIKEADIPSKKPAAKGTAPVPPLTKAKTPPPPPAQDTTSKDNEDILSMLNTATESNEPVPKSKASKTEAKTPKPPAPKPKTASPVREPGTTTKIDAGLFLCLGLFNFFSTQLLIGFLASQLDIVRDMFLESNTIAALASVLLTFLVLRPNFRSKGTRSFTFLVFVFYLIAVGYQIVTHMEYTPGNYFFTPAVVAMISLLAAIILGFARLDKIHSANNAQKKPLKAGKAPKPQKSKPPVAVKKGKPPVAKKAASPIDPKIQEKARQQRAKKALSNPKPNPNPENNPIKDLLNLEKPQPKDLENTPPPATPRESSNTAPKKINFPLKSNAPKPVVEPRGQATDRLKKLEETEHAKDPLNQLEALVKKPEAAPEKKEEKPKFGFGKTQSKSKAFNPPKKSKQTPPPENSTAQQEPSADDSDEDDLLNSLKLSLPKRDKDKN